jgi:hypothetical protein
VGRSNSRGFPQTGGGYFTGSADEAYETIRQSTTDVEAIARNTGIKPENIQKVKNHVSHEEHLLDRYVDVGIPAEMRRFDSELGIANAWSREPIRRLTGNCCVTRLPKRISCGNGRIQATIEPTPVPRSGFPLHIWRNSYEGYKSRECI